MKLALLTLLLISHLLAPIKFALGAESSTSNPVVKDKKLFDILSRIKTKQQSHEQNKQENNVNNVVESENVSPKKSLLPQNDSSGIPTGEELILSIYIDKLYLADTFAYKTDNGTKINLYDFFESLDFPIDIDLEEGIIAGWYINESNRFELNLSTAEHQNGLAQLTINEQNIDVLSESITIEGDELYVEGDTLAQWFNLEISYNYNDQILILQSQQALPIQAKLAREGRNIYVQNTSASVMPWKESSYQLFSSPLIDFQINASTDNDDNNYVSYSALGQHDLGYFSSQYYLAANNDNGISDARIKLSKIISDKSMFSALSGDNFEVGDINPTQISTRYSSSLSRGFSVSSDSNNEISFNRINLNGDIQPGWDIELYRNTILIDKHISIQNGRYEFNNIDLLYGNNVFEMIMYGPQGQVEKRTKEVYLDRNMLSANEASYGFSVTQEGKSVIKTNNSNNHLFREDGWLVAGRYNQGINKLLSLDFGLSSYFQNDKEKEDRYTSSLGVNLQLFDRLLLTTNSTFDNQENMSNGFNARMPWSNHTFLYQYQKTEANIQEDNITGNSETKSTFSSHLFAMNGQLLHINDLRMNYQNQFRYNVKDNLETTAFTNSISANFKRFMLQNEFTWQETKDDLNSFDSVFGSVNVNTNFGPVFTRLSSTYAIKPETDIVNVSADLSLSVTDTIYSNVRVSYAPKLKRYNSRFSVNWHNDSVNVNTYINVDSDDEWSIGLLFRFALGYQLDYNKAFISSTPLANSGSTMVRVFKDDNANNEFDPGEELLKGVKVKAVQSYRQGVSDEDGIAIIKGMMNNQKTDLVIDPSTLDDPFLIPLGKGIAFTPRTGFLNSIDYPVVTSSEIDGTVYLVDKKGIETPLSFVDLNLLNEVGDIVGQARTEYDGYYLFVDLPPGQYKVSIAEEYIKKKKLDNTADLSIVLTAQGDVINGSDFILSQLEFTSGYVANIGKFSSVNMLKTYWYLTNRRNRAKLKHSVFYVKDDMTNKYQLNLAFYKTEAEANIACKAANAVKINCHVEAYELQVK